MGDECKQGEFFSERFPFVRGLIALTNVPANTSITDLQAMPHLDVKLTYKGGHRNNEEVCYRAEKDAGGGWSFFHEKTYTDMTMRSDATPAIVRFHLMGVQALISATSTFAA